MFHQVYNQGFKAQLNGLSLAQNPYVSLSKMWHAWAEGWLDAAVA